MSSTSNSLASERVLLIEDSPTQAFELALALSQEELDVEIANSAEEGYAMVCESHFDLVLTDLHLPGMTGFELCEKLRATPELDELRVVVLTSQREPANVLEGLAAGAHGFMTKARPPDQIAAEVCRQLERAASAPTPDPQAPAPRVAVARFMGQEYEIDCGKQQVVDVLVSFFEELVRLSNEARLTSQLKEANQKLLSEVAERKHAEQRALAASKAKSTFLANMSHELRTPLNAISGYTELVMESLQEEGRQQMHDDLSRVLSSASHLLSLIEDVLDLSKVEAGKLDLHIEPIEVVPFIEEVAAFIRPAMLKNNNDFVIRFDLPDTVAAGTIEADAKKLRQSLLNLLSNAAKFTHDGQITLEVHTEADGAGDWVVFTVSDTGIGIDESTVDVLFKPFEQADKTATRQFEGTGLGLSITKRLCELMDGQVDVTSQAGEGSTFTIRLPRQSPRGTGSDAPGETLAAESSSGCTDAG